MEKRLAVIEISNREVRLIIGNVVNDKPVILYQTSRPVSGLLSHGEIIDFETLTQIVSSLATISDANIKMRFHVSDATIILPASGLNVFKGDKTTNVVSPTSIIETIDIQNVLSLVTKEPIPGGNDIIDIIPDYFITETKKYTEPPIGEKSNFLRLRCKVYTLPNRIVEQYRDVVQRAGIRAKRIFVAPYGIIELAKQSNEFPKDYFLVDMGAQTSTISLVGNQSLFGSVGFTLGGDDLIKFVADEMQISTDEARELVEFHGINERELTFKPVIAKTIINGVQVSYGPDDLNRIIVDFFRDYYFKQFDVVLGQISGTYSTDNLSTLPIVFTGGFSRLHGFDKLAKEKFAQNQSIHYLEPEAIGARSPSYSALVGALLASSKYKGSLSDQRARVSQVERVETKQQE